MIKNPALMVRALRQRQIPVTHVVYPDEGHGFARPENALDFFGRAEPWGAVPGSSAEAR